MSPLKVLMYGLFIFTHAVACKAQPHNLADQSQQAAIKVITTGKLSAEMEVKAPAREAWDICGTLKLIDVVVPSIFKEIKVLKGDGGVGTILDLIFNPGAPFSSYEERIHKVDERKMSKEIDVYRGGFLEVGFNMFRISWDVKPKSKTSCIIKVTLEFDVKEESVANISYVSIQPFIGMMKAVAKYLAENQKPLQHSPNI
ncbi:hypothetical protein RJ640_002853 [Escallonia rubra]|uniref:Bet v I/Major latex protein domain-containing protein n=1 Tax=Escallonia rubra TaxID=112253 RepID=A0AA88QCK4_9ASTE|nr:hypothetical protein RJ640_002853 [Escallonia rubra]